MTKKYKQRYYRPFNDYYNASDPSACWGWTGMKDKDGYGAYKGIDKPRRAHRIAWEKAHGPIPEGLCVLHKCDNRKCVNPSHLFIGTRKDNAVDKVNKGRHPCGDKSTSAKLTEAQAKDIITSKKTYKQLASEYGISAKYIWKIKSGLRWSYLHGTDNPS